MNAHDADQKVLFLLSKNGSDLTKPHRTDHFFYFKSEEAAKAVGALLQTEGCHNVRIYRTPVPWWKRLLLPRAWSCTAEAFTVPSEAAVFATRDRYIRLAQEHGGAYDGWGADITP
jgi:hypothetical protein